MNKDATKVKWSSIRRIARQMRKIDLRLEKTLRRLEKTSVEMPKNGQRWLQAATQKHRAMAEVQRLLLLAKTIFTSMDDMVTTIEAWRSQVIEARRSRLSLSKLWKSRQRFCRRVWPRVEL